MLKVLRIRYVLLTPDLPSLQAVQLLDKRIGATLRSLCLALGLILSGQLRRIRRHPLLAAALVTTSLATAGGSQETEVLLAWAIPLWVVGIQTNRFDEDKRAAIEIVQTQAVEALYRAFWDVAVPAEEAIEAEILSEESLDARLEERLAAIEAALPDKARLEERLAAIEATMRDLAGRVVADERLLAATIARLLAAGQRVQALERNRRFASAPRRSRRGRGRRRPADHRAN